MTTAKPKEVKAPKKTKLEFTHNYRGVATHELLITPGMIVEFEAEKAKEIIGMPRAVKAKAGAKVTHVIKETSPTYYRLEEV